MKRILFTFLPIGLCIFSAEAQNNPITANLTFDAQSGSFQLNSSRIYKVPQTDACGKKRTSMYRIFQLREGTGVTVQVTGLNPLKYSASTSVTYTTVNGGFPELNVADPGKIITPSKAEEPKSGNNLQGIEGSKGIVPVEQKVKKLLSQIDCANNAMDAFKKSIQYQREIAESFNNFSTYYKQVKEYDNLTQQSYDSELQQIIVMPLNRIARLTSVATTNGSGTAIPDITALKVALTEQMQSALKELKTCAANYTQFLATASSGDKEIVIKKQSPFSSSDIAIAMANSDSVQIEKILKWAEETAKNYEENVWPDIAKANTSYQAVRSLNFNILAGTIFGYEDITSVSLKIKKLSDNSERIIEPIRFLTTGGIRLDYGVGLYLSNLADDQYLAEKTTKFEKVAQINGTTIDSVLQAVTYSKLQKVNAKSASWGTMAFFQARSNLGRSLNYGGYVGTGLIMNTDAKPIISIGASLVFGTFSKLNLNVGLVWGKVERLNPLYKDNIDTPYKGEILQPTISVMQRKCLVGVTWNLGKAKTNKS